MSDAYLTSREAKLLMQLPDEAIAGILKLASHGLKPAGIIEYASAVAKDQEPAPFPALTGPKPLTIQLHSFLADPRQYSDTYSLAMDVVERLRALEMSDRDEARKELAAVISATPRIAASGKPVRVVDDGAPGGAPGSAQPLAGASSVTKSLAAEIASNSTLYGSYKFDAFETQLGVTERFAVDLGENFYVVTFSKKNAIAIARLVCVHGRSYASAAPYVVYVDSAGRMLRGGDIDSRRGDCRRGPRDTPDESTRVLGAPIRGGDHAPASLPSRARPEGATGTPSPPRAGTAVGA
ncbi:hypothetical protein JT07_s4gp1 [Cladosporium cladosporioides virus 1]|uniref:Uncharacterized protein n=1 Tax=Cladosporium cladosporioides virus 1 TaxID=1529605 RepID=A0A076JWY5_9VIRU|nr:hypothetical protein JT07_s4gp1 [Cladosporium cladosporioides virus 1]AII80570.1 hypothetical protein [Cladosporium cladosporioides virus 1]